MDTKELGDLGESLACEYLVKKGYKILGKNYRISFGEIDIIAKKKWRLFVKNEKTIHFVEVKTIIGNNDSFFPEDRVDYKKQKKLRQLAEIWLTKNNFPDDHPYQIDVVGILVPPAGESNYEKYSIHYFENVIKDL